MGDLKLGFWIAVAQQAWFSVPRVTWYGWLCICVCGWVMVVLLRLQGRLRMLGFQQLPQVCG